MRLNDLPLKWSKINHIFISHLHGDHYFGLIGLISTLHLLRRTRPLYVFAPEKLKKIIELQLAAGNTQLNYELKFNTIPPDKKEIIFQNDDITVTAIPLKHRIDCSGFLFQENKKERKINREKLEEYNVPFDAIPLLKKGNDYVDINNGKIITNEELTTEPLRSRSYAYCCDTAFNKNMFEQIKNVDLLYHDCTFSDESRDRATETYHTTAIQAAETAMQCNAKQLMIGHFSSKYKDVSVLLNEAKTVFKNTIVAVEGETVVVER